MNLLEKQLQFLSFLPRLAQGGLKRFIPCIFLRTEQMLIADNLPFFLSQLGFQPNAVTLIKIEFLEVSSSVICIKFK